MPTSLAAQLAQAVSLNAPLLSEAARKKHRGTSYLFTSSSAQTEDIESIHALALNALGQLRLIYPAFRDIDSPNNENYQVLFSSKAKETDRTLLAKDEAKTVDDAVKHCLRILGPCLLDSAAGKVIEWLVRRFRVNEFNVADVLALFFPYHESPHFAKMVSILQLENTNFAFLMPFKQAAKPLPRNVLADAMRKDVDLTRFIVNLLPNSYGGDPKLKTIPTVHRTLLAFNLTTLLEFITRVDDDGLDAGTLSFLLPSLLCPLNISKNEEGTVSAALRKDGILGSFVLLSALSQKTSFTSEALSTVVMSMIKATANPLNPIDCSQLLTAIISVLAPQTTSPIIPPNICEKLIRISGFGKAIQNALGWAGSAKVVGLLIPFLTEKVGTHESAAAVAEQLIASEKASEEIAAMLVKALFDASLNAKEDGGKKISLLSVIRQRHPETLQKYIEAIGREDKEKMVLAEKVLLKISTSGGGANDVMLAVADADPSVRCAAVRSVMQRISSDDLTETEMLSLQDSVKARLLDVHPNVLEVIYGEVRTAVSLFAQSPDLLSSICTFLTSQQPSKAVLRTHLQFFSNALYNAHPDLGLKVILSLILHFALLSKPRQKTATSVWEVVCDSPLSKHTLLKGVSEVVKPALTSGDEKASLDADEMASINAAVVARLAENVQASDDFDMFVTWISDSILPGPSSAPNDSHVRLLALLVGGTLVSNLTNSHQIETSRKLLNAITKAGELDGFEGDRVQETFDDAVFEDGLFKSVVLKPNSRTTLQKAQLRVLARIPSAKLPQSSGGHVNWFFDHMNEKPSSSDGYVVLMRDVYVTVNSMQSSGFVSHTNQKLFESIGPKALLFLAGLWTSNAPSVTAVSKYVALKHALAFLQAQQSAEVHVDFQVIIPSLICALQETDKRVRAAAMDCLSAIGSSAGGPKSSDVYAYDSVYGKSSDSLQFVDSNDSVRYVQTLVEHRDHLANDPKYIAYIHNKELSYSKSDNKKDAKYKQRILCFLLSHIISLPSRQTKVDLLRSLKEVHNGVKLQMLAPLLRESLKLGEGLLHEDNSDVVLLSLAAFDTTSVRDLSSDQSSSWALLLDSIKAFHLLGQSTPLWTSLLSHIGTIYNALPSSRQHDLCMTLVTTGISSDDSLWGIKPFLRKCIKQALAFTTILKDLRPSTSEARLRETKRSKLDSASPDETVHDLSRLTFFTEALASQQLPGSLDLVSELLEVLGQVVNGSTASHSDTGYIEQLLMSAIDSSASQVKELPNLSPNAIQLDVLVKLMRTDNPQTFNQALLLMASLARLSSESVLQNVLPIFTFMGSNVFHRDDSYSFKVIQKTTEGIVPVVMSSLRERFANNHDLHIGARDLLKTFTDAATHVPRHRRINFFIHLIEVMNPADFLAPTCMLLVDKLSTKVARQNPRDALSTLSLPLSIFEHHTPAIRLLAIQEVLTEVRRLLAVVDGVDAPEKPFLEETTGDEPGSTILTRKRQCRSLISFVGHVLKQLPSTKLEGREQEDLRSVLATLVEFSTVRDEKQASGGNELSETSRWSLLNALGTIRVDEFASAILSMVQGVDKRLQEGSLLLLSERFPEIASSARGRIQNTTAQILECVQRILLSANDSSLQKSALDALRAIATTAQAKDETPLAAIVPTILQIVHEQLSNVSAISVLPILISKLGPRMIPHLRSTVDTCVFIAKSGTGSEILAEDFTVLTALVTSIPTFWGSAEVKAVCEIYISDKIGSPEFAHLADKLVKALSKHVSSKLLLASLLELWPSVEFVASPKGEQRSGRFFDLLKRCIHHSSRNVIQEVLRNLFSRFLQSFDFRATVPLTELTVEDKVIGAYMELVIKLNETTFQPLFRRSCDWAFGTDPNNSRKITFFRTFTSLLDLFKDLMTPYMTFVIEPLADLLGLFGAGTADDQPLWTSCMENLSKSLAVDEGTFWNDDRVRAIYNPVVQQIPVCVGLKVENGKMLLTDCLLSLVGCADGDPLLKAINLAIIQHSKSEDARIRLYSLSCSVSIWEKFGRKLSAFGIQTATFVMECSEDDNDEVVRECRRLRDAIELQVGKIEGL